jgi:hypothetical protein
MIIYTKHARARMQQRNITEQEVEYCLQEYLTSYPDRDGNPIYRVDLPSGRRIKVVIKANTADPLVITVGD